MNTHKPPESGACCGRCHFWTFLSSVSGQCHRMPPAAHFEDGHYWPVTGRSDWCGEFKSKFSATCEEMTPNAGGNAT